MKVAAILVNYRDAAGIAAAVQSVYADESDTAVVVVDNSDDKAQWNALQSALDKRALSIRASSNLGFGKGCNLGMQYTDAPLIMLVNPDVRLRPGCIAALRGALLANPKLAAAAPRQYLDPDIRWMLPPSILPTALGMWATEHVQHNPALQPRWVRATRSENLRYWKARSPTLQRALSGGLMMVRRASLEAAHGPMFDPRFFMYFEDSDLCMRLRRMCWQLALVPQAQAIHVWRNAPHKGPLMLQGLCTYLDKYHPNENPWRERLAALRQTGESKRVEWYAPVKRLQSTSLQVACGSGVGWCIEVSPHINLWPAVGHVGCGPALVELQPALQALAGAGAVHVRWSRLDDPMLVDAAYYVAAPDLPDCSLDF